MKNILRNIISAFFVIFLLGCSVYKGIYAYQLVENASKPTLEASEPSNGMISDIKTNANSDGELEDIKRYAAIPIEHPIFNYYYWTGDNSSGEKLTLLSDSNGKFYYVLPRYETCYNCLLSNTPWDYVPSSWYSGDSGDKGFKYLVNSDGSKSDWKRIDDDSYVLDKTDFMMLINDSCTSPYFEAQSNAVILNLDYPNNYASKMMLKQQMYYSDYLNNKSVFTFKNGFGNLGEPINHGSIDIAPSLCYNPAYKVQFNKGATSGVTGNCHDFSYPGGLKVYLPTFNSSKGSLAKMETFKRDGYKALGWEVRDAVGNPVPITGDFYGSASGQAPSSIYFTMPNSNVTVTMLWSKIYSLNYSSGCPDESSHYNYPKETYCEGDEVRLKANRYKRPADSGYIFLKWVVSDSDGNEVTVINNKFNMPASDVTITALWAKTYTVTYDPGSTDVTGSIASATVVTGTEYTLADNVFKRKGYVFDGWSVTDVAGTDIPVSGDNKITMPMKNLKATATWREAEKINITVRLLRLDDTLEFGYEEYKTIDKFIYEGEDYDPSSEIADHPEWTVDSDLSDKVIYNADTSLDGRIFIVAFRIEKCEIIINSYNLEIDADESHSAFGETDYYKTPEHDSHYDPYYSSSGAVVDTIVGEDFDLTPFVELVRDRLCRFGYNITSLETLFVTNFTGGSYTEDDVNIVSDVVDGSQKFYIKNVPAVASIRVRINTQDSYGIPVYVTSYYEPEDMVGCDISEYSSYADYNEYYIDAGAYVDLSSFKNPNLDTGIRNLTIASGNININYDTTGQTEIDNIYELYQTVSPRWKDAIYTKEDSEDPECNHFIVYYRIKRGYLHFDPGCTDYTGSMDDIEFSCYGFDESGVSNWYCVPNQFKREGYDFIGWQINSPTGPYPDYDYCYYSSDDDWGIDVAGVLSDLYDPDDPINSMSLTATAQWEKIKVYVDYSVEYYQMNLNRSGYDLIKTSDSKKVEQGTKINITPETYAGFKINSVISEYTDSGIIESKVFRIYYDRINNYKVSFDKGVSAADGLMDSITGKQYEEEITLPVCEFTCLGYDFADWEVKTAGGETVEVKDNKFIMPASDVIVTATWEMASSTYSIEYYQMNLDRTDYVLVETEGPFKVDSGEEIMIFPKSYSGFTLNDTLSDYYSAALYDKEYTFRIAYDRINTYKISFSKGSDSAEGSMTEISNLSFEEEITVPDCDFTNPGYEFKEFKVETISGTDVTVSSGKFKMPASDIVITAFWTPGKSQYYVEYYQMNLDRDEYIKVDADTEGPIEVDTESAVTITPKAYEGFTLNTTKSELSDTELTDYGHVFKIYYDRISTYKATFDKGVDSADGSMSDLTGLSFDEEISLSTCDYTNAGYDFKEFKVETTGGIDIPVISGKFKMPASDVVITALWTAGKSQYYLEYYQMNLDRDEYIKVDADTEGPIEVDTESAVTITPKAYEGFTLNTTKSELSDTEFTDYGHVFKIYYDRISTYKATFDKGADDVEGTMLDINNLSFGQEVTIPTNLYNYEGYDFIRFDVSKSVGGDAVLVKDGKFIMPACDVIIKAVWSEGRDYSYNVEYYQMKLDRSDYVKVDQSLGIVIAPRSRINIIPKDYEGFEFNEGLSEYSDDKFTRDGWTFKLYYDRVNTYTVKYSRGDSDATGSIADLTDCSFGQSITITSDKFSADKYIFKGWQVTRDDTSATVKVNSSNKFTMPGSDVTITALWEVANTKYQLVHKLMNTDGTTYQDKVIETKEIPYFSKLEISPKSYEGFTLDTAISSALTIDSIETANPIITLYYTRNQYELKYSGGAPDVTGSMTTKSDCLYKASIELDENSYTKTGYKFKGFEVTRDSDGSKITLKDGRFIMPAGNVTAKALWELVKYPYTCTHYIKKIYDSGYEVFKVEKLAANHGTSVSIKPLDDNGLIYTSIPDEVVSDIVTADHSPELKLYYDRKKFKIVFDKNDTNLNNDETGYSEHYYLEEVNLSQYDFSYEKFKQVGWHLVKYNNFRDTKLKALYIGEETGGSNSTISNIVNHSLKSIGDITGLINKAATDIDIVISPMDTFKMPAYDLTARVVWKDTKKTPKTAVSYAVDTSDKQLLEFYAGIFTFSILMLILIGFVSKSHKKQKSYSRYR